MAKSPLGPPRAANGSIWENFGVHFGTHFYHILILSSTLKTKKLQYLPSLFEILASQKLSFWDPFSITFSTPFWDPLWESLLAHLGPQRCRPWQPQVDFGAFLGPPWGPKWGLGAPMGGQGGPKRLVPRVALEVPFASWSRLVVRRGPENHSYRLGDPLG